MITDIGTVIWKEWKEYLLQRGNFRGGWLGFAFTLGIFGVFMPLQSGAAWVESPLSMAVWGWLPLFIVAGVVADSFAGERERHTLETLLATRLSDRAILLGKVGAAVLYAWGMTLLIVLLGLITVNLSAGAGRFLIYSADFAIGIVGLSFLGATLVASLGVLVSLRAATVRQAAQTLSISMMVVFVIPFFALQLMPKEMMRQVALTLQAADLSAILPAVMVVLVVADAALLVVAMARFRRARLILD